MKNLLVGGAVLEMRPNPGWSFRSFDPPEIQVHPRERGVYIESRPVVLEEDIKAAGSRLLGKMYVASGYADVPGTVAQATIQVDRGTLSEVGVVGGAADCAHTGTCGTFSITCIPALGQYGDAMLPDTSPSHTGKWSVKDPAQRLANAD